MVIKLAFETHAQADTAFEAYKIQADQLDAFLIMQRYDRTITMTLRAQ